ncbi:MAG TPA: hypothetical protein VJ872_12080 [Nocardioides sp.]|nr:hypothetical protein [Nocardioides sp.]
MKNKALIALAVAAFALLFATSPYVANAAGLITGAQIKNNTVTGADVKESTLATVPSAGTLAPLRSGHTESGAFAVGGAKDAAPADYIGWGITYPQRLAKPIPDSHIIDTEASPQPTLCPGAGRAARGYLCLYFYDHHNIGTAYGYSDDSDPSSPYTKSALHGSVGVGIYDEVTDTGPYADGVWTVTAP